MKIASGRFLLLCFIALCLTGCWDYQEIEQVNFVFGAGVEHSDEDWKLITEVVKSTGAGQEAEFKTILISTEGRSISGAARALVNPAGMTLVWSHTQVFVVSEEVAKAGIIPAVEFALRGRDIRTTVFMFVARDCTVNDIFASNPIFADSISVHLVNVVKFHPEVPVFYPQEMWEFNKDLIEVGISGALPTIQLVHEGGDLVPIVKGTSLFRADKMVGWLDGEESQLFSLLHGLPHRGRFVMDTKVAGEDVPLTYKVERNRVSIKPIENGGELTAKIDLELDLDLPELDSVDIDFLDRGVVSELEKQVGKALKRRIEELLRKIHVEYNTDALGFGLMTKKKLPKVWREIEANWENVLRNLPVDVYVDVTIVSSGVLSKSIQGRF